MNQKNNISITDELIVNYLTGEAGPEEAMALHDWLESTENKLYFDQFQTTWQNSHPAKRVRKANTGQAWKSIQPNLQVPKPSGAHRSLVVDNRKLIYRIAASVLMIAIIGVFVYKKFNDKTAPLISVNTTDGLKKTILPDRSQVVISRYSKLTYVKNFDGASREVNLTGEAFFDVTHDADKPFIIHTAIADVRVVGTSFNVAADSNKTQVSVEKGKVLVYTKDDSVYIEPGQAVTIQAGRESITADTAVDKNSWGYATRKFEFKNASLNEVFRCIEKSYPCSIEVQNNAINNCKLTASFENASAEYIVTLIAETLDLTLTTKNNVFVLQGKGCP